MSPVTLAAVGDVVLTRPWEPGAGSRPEGFDAVVRLLQQSDVVFGDLETPLSRSGYPREKLVTLRADPEIGPVLRRIGFDVLERYRALEKVCRADGSLDEADWFSRRIKALGNE